MAPLKRDITLKAGLLMMNLSANFVKDSASELLNLSSYANHIFIIINKSYLLIIILFNLVSVESLQNHQNILKICSVVWLVFRNTG